MVTSLSPLPDVQYLQFCSVFPHRSDDVVVEPYNSVLTLKRLKHHVDAVTVPSSTPAVVFEVLTCRKACRFGSCQRDEHSVGPTSTVPAGQVLSGSVQVLDNPALDAIAGQQLGFSNPTVAQMNSLVALAMAATTATLRFPGGWRLSYRCPSVHNPQCHRRIAAGCIASAIQQTRWQLMA